MEAALPTSATLEPATPVGTRSTRVLNIPARERGRGGTRPYRAEVAPNVRATAPSVSLPLRFMLTGLVALLFAVGWIITKPSILASYHYNQYVIAATHLDLSAQPVASTIFHVATIPVSVLEITFASTVSVRSTEFKWRSVSFSGSPGENSYDTFRSVLPCTSK